MHINIKIITKIRIITSKMKYKQKPRSSHFSHNILFSLNTTLVHIVHSHITVVHWSKKPLPGSVHKFLGKQFLFKIPLKTIDLFFKKL